MKGIVRLVPGLAIAISLPTGAEAQDRAVAITNATIMTAADAGKLEGATIVFEDGRIVAVGTDVDVPDGAQVIDGTGKFVTPGIVDAHSHIAADAINEGSVSVSAMVSIRDVIDPTDVAIYREAAGGTTTSHVMHGSANPIGGQNVVIKHRWGADADGLILEGAPPTIKFALGENPKRQGATPFGNSEPRYPASRMGVMDVIRQAFIEATEYKAEWDAYEARVANGDDSAIPPRRDLKLDALREVLEGTRLVHAHSYRADEILQLMRVAEEFDFRIHTFQHVLEGYRVADEIREHGAHASTFSDWWAYKVEAYEAIPYNAAIMTQRGVLVSINSDSDEEGRHLNQEAAKTMKWGGLTEEEALALVTINPARQLMVDDRIGSLEAGKDADVVLWENYPLSSYARVRTTWVDGNVVFDIDQDMAMRQRIAAEKAELREMLGEGDTANGGRGRRNMAGGPGNGGYR
ncbi:MAG: amidohydrolase [Gemmatimonadota bacterium]|nr:amidohydrolase [Gemmatimonadota bacterium]